MRWSVSALDGLKTCCLRVLIVLGLGAYSALTPTEAIGLGYQVSRGSARGPTSQEIAASVFPSVLLLVMEDQHGQPLSLGSGFVVSPGTIATNLHVIEGASSGKARFVNRDETYEVLEVLATDEQHDLAILSLAADAPRLTLDTMGQVRVGDEVYVVGNPQGLEGTFTEGIISGVRSVGSDKLLQITAPISAGSSGGPVLNASGDVIGIAVATLQEGQNLNFAIPADYLSALLASEHSPEPLSAIQPTASGQSDYIGPSAIENLIVSHVEIRSVSSELIFSLRNTLAFDVLNVSYLAIYYDSDGLPVHADEGRVLGTIRAGLAVVATDFVSLNVMRLADRVEIRILSFTRAP